MKRVAIVTGLILGLIITLVLVACIPRDRIQQTITESAEYLTSHEEYFYPLIPGTQCSKLDEIADAVLLNIAYNLDERHPLESVMWAKYYQAEGKDKKESTLEMIKEGKEANQQYLRYWHGSLIFVRPLLLIWNIKQIYAFHTVVLTGLLIWLFCLLFRKGLRTEAAAFGLSMIAVNVWFVPMCLEYTWMFLVCFVASIVAVKLKGEISAFFFLVVGVVAGFLDFLTTETLTFLIPMMLILRIRKGARGNLRLCVKSGILWLVGYGGMWALKWGVAAIVLRQNVIPYLKDSFELHTSVTTNDTTAKYIFDALMKNLNCLFPVGYGTICAIAGILLLGIIVLGAIAKNKVSLRRDIVWQRMMLYVALGLVPYFRYAVLHFHAWYHYFFTYRAQAATVMALCFAIAEVVQINRKQTHAQPMPMSRR